MRDVKVRAPLEFRNRKQRIQPWGNQFYGAVFAVASFSPALGWRIFDGNFDEAIDSRKT
ncbi:hypothetical protein [Nocardiopsis synnemataformans]|uniref:hypothetical protein n=1 Tax=Nocardiopsis synnemataformans TaxID=61305 RepID=UPI003EBA05B1